MHVLFTVSYYAPYVSGLTLAAKRWAEAVTKTYPVTVLTMNHTGTLPELETINAVSIERAHTVFRISKGFVSLDWFIRLLRLVNTHDTVVIHLPEFEGVVAALVAKFQGKRVVSIYHCEVDLPKGFLNDIVQSVLEVSNFMTLAVSDHIITYTDDYAAKSRIMGALRRLKHRSAFSSVIPPIEKPTRNTRTENYLRNSLGSTPIVIGVAARLAQEKGIEYLLAAVPMLKKRMRKSFKIVIAGSPTPVGEEIYRQTMSKLLAQYADTVLCVGEIPPDHMGSFYRMLTMLVLPSVNSTEAFGLVQAEAMYAGIPVIATNLPGVRIPITKTGMGILVPPRDAHALSDAIVRIAKARASYIRPTNAVTAEFSSRRSVTDFLNVIR